MTYPQPLVRQGMSSLPAAIDMSTYICKIEKQQKKILDLDCVALQYLTNVSGLRTKKHASYVSRPALMHNTYDTLCAYPEALLTRSMVAC